MIKKKKSPIPASSLPPENIIRRQPSRVKINAREIDALTQFPEYYAEETMGGHMPNTESDDDSFKGIQEWGFYLNADDEHPQEINEQAQLDKGEKARRRRRSSA